MLSEVSAKANENFPTQIVSQLPAWPTSVLELMC